ncbi:MAD2L1-binding protein [Euwallacea fornicatus]|uniref:MAD2L1-binding protein n=1 Tax=Euwallacea fornicatus TaxID=995702 RepID=UPI00338E4CBD
MPQTQDEFTISISDELTLTPFAGASIVNEILKSLLYQKCQIPFPYNWLEHVVEKRRKRLNESTGEHKKLSLTHESHYRIVSSAYDHLEQVMRGISKEFCEESSGEIKEIVVMFGPGPSCPREVLTINIPKIAQGHVERNHVGQLNKNLRKVLRNVFLSQRWVDSINSTLPCTNTYIYLKKHLKSGCSDSTTDTFQICSPPQILSNIKHSKFHIDYSPTGGSNCCSELLIFEESNSVKHSKERLVLPTNDVSQEHIIWYRSKGLIKGFKDCFVNKVSVCQLW